MLIGLWVAGTTHEIGSETELRAEAQTDHALDDARRVVTLQMLVEAFFDRPGRHPDVDDLTVGILALADSIGKLDDIDPMLSRRRVSGLYLKSTRLLPLNRRRIG
ncbi:MAG: hypothetical protein IT305_12760 [Chloroflexi bacterium]|nr:hypothetical protein [Chloroflexota bacterium]